MPSSIDFFPSSDKTGVLEQSALIDIRAANRLSYFAAAAASLSSTHSSGGWSDLNAVLNNNLGQARCF